MFTVRQQGTSWCFTINNPTPDDDDRLLSLSTQVRYLIYAYEVGENGTPHWQGYVVFFTNQRTAAVSRLLPRAHLQIARGDSKQNRDYVTKPNKDADGNEVSKPPETIHEFGEQPPVRGQAKVAESVRFRDWVLASVAKPTPADVAREFPTLFLRSGRTQTLIDALWDLPATPPGLPYRPHQQALADILDAPADSRKIIFVVDPAGNKGKSYFAHSYYRSRPSDVQLLSAGKRDDLAFAIDERKSVFIFDLPRSTSEFLQYSILEQLKNGIIFSNKYESRMKQLPYGRESHVVVMMNEYPDVSKLSSDRPQILYWS